MSLLNESAGDESPYDKVKEPGEELRICKKTLINNKLLPAIIIFVLAGKSMQVSQKIPFLLIDSKFGVEKQCDSSSIVFNLPNAKKLSF